MSLANDLGQLVGRQRELRDHLQALRVTVAEDRPLDLDLALVDRHADAIDDLISGAEEGVLAAEEAARAAAPPADWPRLGRALLLCQERWADLGQRLSDDLLSYERVAELRQTARRYGGEWVPWVGTVHTALRRCGPALQEVGRALNASFRGWLEWSDVGARGLAGGSGDSRASEERSEGPSSR
jgi:hypothetical protein